MFLSCAAIMLTAAPAAKVIFPGPAAKQFQFRPSDNGTDAQAFTQSLNDREFEVKFKDRDNQDNYLHVDLGKFDILPYFPGGCIEVDAAIDQPVLRMTVSVSDPACFWPRRAMLESEANMTAGRCIYRFYLDTMTRDRLAEGNDHLYLFLHDYSGKSRGQATVKIYGIKINQQTGKWKQEKSECYSRQYNWRKFEDLGLFYRGRYDNLTAWAELADNPFLQQTSLNGKWSKTYCGDKTWDYAFLPDKSFADPGKPLNNAQEITVPEPAKADQAGGHYLYKRNFELVKKNGGRVFMRFDDLADSAEIYVNGQWIGTQSSVRKRHEWILENGSRHVNTWGKPIREVVKWQHFERCGIPCPFNVADMHVGDAMMLPVYTGEYAWPYAFDITDAVQNGSNTVAVRLYGCPVKGWWIFKNNDDRAARNVFGILGNVRLLCDNQSAIADINRLSVGTAGNDGIATHRIECRIDSRFSGEIVRVTAAGAGISAELKAGAGSRFTGEVKLPADFNNYMFTITAFNRNDQAIDRRDLNFNGTVVEVRDGRMFVNGDRYIIRGINGALGIEWDNGRTVTRREWLRMLRFYQQLGFNTLRLEGVQEQHLKDAQQAGMMVMPVYASASCNNSLTALGNLNNPDYEFNTDAHKEMALTLSSATNVLLWNSGNENHHTGGYDDKEMMDKYLETARESIRRFDPYRRGVVYANLDTYGTSWFFSAGQDVLGYNTYAEPDLFRKMMNKLYSEVKKPVVFTEWGFHDNEPRAIKDRNENVAGWEKRMTEKARIMFDTPGSLGGFLYAYHGELKDDRGRNFLQQLMASFNVRKDAGCIVFENQDACPLRKVNLQLVSDTDVPAAQYVAELAPGQLIRIPLPETLAAEPGLRLEIRFETHRGLNHFYSRMADQLKATK
jgi:hypothetical protein